MGLVIVVVVLGGGRGLFVMSCRVVLGEDSSEDGGEGMDTMAPEDNTEAAVSADANDKESDKIIVPYLTDRCRCTRSRDLERDTSKAEDISF